MLSKVVYGEQLHSGPFCAGWDGEGINRTGVYSDHTGELPKRGGEEISASTAVLGATEADFSVNTRPGSEKTLSIPGLLM